MVAVKFDVDGIRKVLDSRRFKCGDEYLTTAEWMGQLGMNQHQTLAVLAQMKEKGALLVAMKSVENLSGRLSTKPVYKIDLSKLKKGK